MATMAGQSHGAAAVHNAGALSPGIGLGAPKGSASLPAIGGLGLTGGGLQMGRERSSSLEGMQGLPRKEASYASTTASKISVASIPLDTLEHIIDDFREKQRNPKQLQLMGASTYHYGRNASRPDATAGGGRAGGRTGGGGGGRSATASRRTTRVSTATLNPRADVSTPLYGMSAAAAAAAADMDGGSQGSCTAGGGMGAAAQPLLPGLPPGAPPPPISSRAVAVLQEPESAAHLQRFLALDPGQFENHFVIAAPNGVPVCDLEEVCCEGAASIDGLPAGRDAVVVLTATADGVPVPRVIPLDLPGPNSLRRTGMTAVLAASAAAADSAAARCSTSGGLGFGRIGTGTDPGSRSGTNSGSGMEPHERGAAGICLSPCAQFNGTTSARTSMHGGDPHATVDNGICTAPRSPILLPSPHSPRRTPAVVTSPSASTPGTALPSSLRSPRNTGKGSGGGTAAGTTNRGSDPGLPSRATGSQIPTVAAVAPPPLSVPLPLRPAASSPTPGRRSGKHHHMTSTYGVLPAVMDSPVVAARATPASRTPVVPHSPPPQGYTPSSPPSRQPPLPYLKTTSAPPGAANATATAPGGKRFSEPGGGGGADVQQQPYGAEWAAAAGAALAESPQGATGNADGDPGVGGNGGGGGAAAAGNAGGKWNAYGYLADMDNISPTRARLQVRITHLATERQQQQKQLQELQQQLQQQHQHHAHAQHFLFTNPNNAKSTKSRKTAGGAGGTAGHRGSDSGVIVGPGGRKILSALSGMDLVRAALKQVERGERSLQADPLVRNSRNSSCSSGGFLGPSGGGGEGGGGGLDGGGAGAESEEQRAARAAEKRQAKLIRALTQLLTTGRRRFPMSAAASIAASPVASAASSRRKLLASAKPSSEVNLLLPSRLSSSLPSLPGPLSPQASSSLQQQQHPPTKKISLQAPPPPPPQQQQQQQESSQSATTQPPTSNPNQQQQQQQEKPPSRSSQQHTPQSSAAQQHQPDPESASATSATGLLRSTLKRSTLGSNSSSSKSLGAGGGGSSSAKSLAAAAAGGGGGGSGRTSRTSLSSAGGVVVVGVGGLYEEEEEDDTVEEATAVAAETGLNPDALVEFAQALDRANEEFRLVEAARERARRIEALLLAHSQLQHPHAHIASHAPAPAPAAAAPAAASASAPVGAAAAASGMSPVAAAAAVAAGLSPATAAAAGLSPATVAAIAAATAAAAAAPSPRAAAAAAASAAAAAAAASQASAAKPGSPGVSAVAVITPIPGAGSASSAAEQSGAGAVSNPVAAQQSPKAGNPSASEPASKQQQQQPSQSSQSSQSEPAPDLPEHLPPLQQLQQPVKRHEGGKPPTVSEVISSLEAPLDRPMSVDLEQLLSAIAEALAAEEEAGLGSLRDLQGGLMPAGVGAATGAGGGGGSGGGGVGLTAGSAVSRLEETFRQRTERYLAQLCRSNPAAFEEVSAAQAEADYRSGVERAKLRLRQLHGEVEGEPLTSAGKPKYQYDKAVAMLQAHRPFFLPPVIPREHVERAPVPPLLAGRGAARPPWDVYTSLFRERKKGDARDVYDTEAVLAAQFNLDWSRVATKMPFMKLVAREDLGVRGKSGRSALEQELVQIRDALAAAFPMIRSAFIYFSIATPEEVYTAAIDSAVSVAEAEGTSAEAAAAEVAAAAAAVAAPPPPPRHSNRHSGGARRGSSGDAVMYGIASVKSSETGSMTGEDGVVQVPTVAESKTAAIAAAAAAATAADAAAADVDDVTGSHGGAGAGGRPGYGILEMNEQRWLAFCTAGRLTSSAATTAYAGVGRGAGGRGGGGVAASPAPLSSRIHDLRQLFWAVNREEERNMTLESQTNNDIAFMRFEFLEALVRAAFFRFIAPGAPRDAADATRQLLRELEPVLPPGARVDPNEFRRTRLYTYEMEMAVVHNLELLTAAFKLYKARDRAKYLGIDHWMSFLESNNLLAPHMGGITSTEARLMFAWSQMVVVDELKLRRRAVGLQLWDFIEAVSRLADRVSLPAPEELDRWLLYGCNIGRHTPLPPGHTRVWTYCNALALGRGGPPLPRRPSGSHLLSPPSRPLAAKFRLLLEYLAGSLCDAWGGANSHETAQSMLRTANMLSGGVELA
ncbi:hypothetical protein Agub_g7803 [Astrephomene gubernaculifera]|uniref:Uncharacterized protein n=1 Tax=Astrephomene gubernaculifera TaxID=47775 RepID=A0AAD3DTB2_9CHLO|nr:hypothetical protein Agub_g7803 [Astrephomene gubernaculifera]